jgi:hypothetical protein
MVVRRRDNSAEVMEEEDEVEVEEVAGAGNDRWLLVLTILPWAHQRVPHLYLHLPQRNRGPHPRGTMIVQKIRILQ